MEFHFPYQALPHERGEFQKNEIPLTQSDIRNIAQVHGAEAAASAEMAVQEIRRQGGINPDAVKTIFPEGIDGSLDENALFRVIGSWSIWSQSKHID